MPTAFESIWLSRQADLDSPFGESFTFASVSGSRDITPTPDPARPGFTAVGRRTEKPVLIGLTSEQNAEEQGHRPGFQGQSLHVSFAIADLPWMPGRGDRATSDETGEALAVSRVERPGRGRVVIAFSR